MTHSKSPGIDSFLERIEKLRAEGGVDLSTTEDLSIAVMNLISLEEHFFFTGTKTGKDEYFDTALEVRNLRKELLEQLMPEHEGETWCASKHLLAATMRLVEVGNKLQATGDKEKARETFGKAYRTYALFWALKLKLAGVDRRASGMSAQKGFDRDVVVEDLVTKLADCCDE